MRLHSIPRLFAVILALLGVVVLVVALAPASASVGTSLTSSVTAGNCTAPVFTTTQAEGTQTFTTGLFWVNNDAWNGTHATQTIAVCGPSSWTATINQPTKGGAVETYPDTEYDVGGRAQINTTKAVATFKNITSTFAEADPTTSGNNWDAAYDLWTTNWTHETMIWNQWVGGQAYWYSQATATATLGGVAYKFYEIGSTCATSTCERIFFRVNQVSSGSVNILDALKWEVANGYLPATAKPTQLQYGVEIAGTPSTEAFSLTGFTVTVDGSASGAGTSTKSTPPTATSTTGNSAPTLSGTLTCTRTATGKAINSSLPVGKYTVTAASCSGLSATGNTTITYAGQPTGFVVTPAPVTVTVSGSQPFGGSPTFTDTTAP